MTTGLPAVRPQNGPKSDTALRAAYWADGRQRQMEIQAQTDSKQVARLIGSGAAVAGLVAIISALIPAAGAINDKIVQPYHERRLAAELAQAEVALEARKIEIQRDREISALAQAEARRRDAHVRYLADSLYANEAAARRQQRWASEHRARGGTVIPQRVDVSPAARVLLL